MGSVRKNILWPVATCIAVALVIGAAISLRGEHKDTHGGGSLAELREALRLEAASPYRWCDLGEGLLEDGQKEKARYCFEQALKLAPNLPPIWMRATFFHFEMDETTAALQCSAKVLKTVPYYDEVIFNYYDRVGAYGREGAAPPRGHRRRATMYFRHILKAGGRRMGHLFAGSGYKNDHSRMTTWQAEHLDFLRRQQLGLRSKVVCCYSAVIAPGARTSRWPRLRSVWRPAACAGRHAHARRGAAARACRGPSPSRRNRSDHAAPLPRARGRVRPKPTKRQHNALRHMHRLIPVICAR